MKAYFPLYMMLAAQASWSAITLTIQDPKQLPLAGVSCAQTGGAAVVSDAQGKATVAIGTSLKPAFGGKRANPLFNIPVESGEKVSLTLFDSRGQVVAAKNIGSGDELNFRSSARGVYHLRISGAGLSVSQSLVNMGTGFQFVGFVPSRDAFGALTKASATAAVEVTCQKAGYATKVYSLNDGAAVTLGFGMQIGRTFDRNAFPKFPGFNLEVVEDFNTADWGTGLTWDANYSSNDVVWEPSDGGFDDNQTRFDPAQVKFRDNSLVMVMEQKTVAASFSHSETDNCNPVGNLNTAKCPRTTAAARNLASGEIRSKNTDFRYGRYEITIDPPDNGTAVGNADGFIAAMFTWFTPRDRNWREVDIEVLGNKNNTFLTNLFFANNVFRWQPGIEKPNKETKPVAAFDAKASHKYAFEWLPGMVKWYVDDELVRTVGTGGETLGSLQVSKLGSKVVMNFWLLNADVGGTGAGNKYPIETKFDNFRYYRWDEDGDKVKSPETP